MIDVKLRNRKEVKKMTLTRQELNERAEVLREEIRNMEAHGYRGTMEWEDRVNELASINLTLWRSARLDKPVFVSHMKNDFRSYGILHSKEIQERGN